MSSYVKCTQSVNIFIKSIMCGNVSQNFAKMSQSHNYKYFYELYLMVSIV